MLAQPEQAFSIATAKPTAAIQNAKFRCASGEPQNEKNQKNQKNFKKGIAKSKKVCYNIDSSTNCAKQILCAKCSTWNGKRLTMQEKHEFEKIPDFETMSSDEIIEEFMKTVRSILERVVYDLPKVCDNSSIDAEISDEINLEDFE